MPYVKVKDNEHLQKNTATGAVINTNRANYMARKAKKHRERVQAEKINNLESEVQQLKEMLEKVLNNGN
jgi:hypothetical protein